MHEGWRTISITIKSDIDLVRDMKYFVNFCLALKRFPHQRWDGYTTMHGPQLFTLYYVTYWEKAQDACKSTFQQKREWS